MFKKGYIRTPEQIAATSAELRRQAVERNKDNPVGSCPKCGSVELVKAGIDRKGRFPRQRHSCPNGHHTLEPREYPLGKKFQAEPWKLLKAIRLMKSGKKSLHKIALASESDRYTIYKLHNHLGRPFNCVCGRPLGHRGHCKPMFDKSIAVRNQLDEIRHARRISKPSIEGWRVAERALLRNLQKLQEIEDGEREE